ncbi:hypothetical protein BBJ28_00021832 [Nothophytophthora sp. Chile5]|nr:hypothetical protein BBJ28_00021832 [Nothophytophthora sp. Chile5]
MYETWSTTALLHAVQVLGCMMAASVLETRGRKRSLACFATLASIVSVALSYAPWSRVVVVVGTCSVAALLAGSWSCVLAYTPEHYATSVRGRGVAYAFGFSRLGAIGGSLLYPHMFDVWVMSVPAITWVFAGLLAAVVIGIVLPYGYSPRVSDDGDDSDDGSETDLESSVGPAEEELRVVASVSGRKKLSRDGEVERELELEELPVEEVEPEASPSRTLALKVEEHED